MRYTDSWFDVLLSVGNTIRRYVGIQFS